MKVKTRIKAGIVKPGHESHGDVIEGTVGGERRRSSPTAWKRSPQRTQVRA
jgi:hypothetical protein